MQRGHLSDKLMVPKALTNKLYSLWTTSVSDLLEAYPAINQAIAFSSLFEISDTSLLLFAKSIIIFSRDCMHLLLRYNKVVVQFQEKLELQQRASQRKSQLSPIYCFEMSLQAALSYKTSLQRYITYSKNGINGHL